MKFLNKPLVIAILSCTALGSSAAQENDSQSYTINLTATVPSDKFQIIPVDSGWIGQTQNMEYDSATHKLKTFEKLFQYKNTAGAIQAKLTGDLLSTGKPILRHSNGYDVIPLSVTFNNVNLSEESTVAVTHNDAKAGGRAALRIFQAYDKELPVSGSFTGSVAMIFEPVVPNQSASPQPNIESSDVWYLFGVPQYRKP